MDEIIELYNNQVKPFQEEYVDPNTNKVKKTMVKHKSR
jgi:hypothetical protein